ncbi:hypothetical protein [Reinekea marinisedimentorum]|uniref:Lipoprotein n=1 Tax=Reinekea marinisedimentorum TaxID=230495 RepID=A0A4R3HUG0_9GAMM|nr:hypothetical protein [Reinekea marinisedimentorum]TCS36123.1 hypothetical protein BCF53_1274 [Reinekea marinisedimentorum]
MTKLTQTCLSKSHLPLALLATLLSGCMIVAPVPEPAPAVVVATPAPAAKVVVAEPAPVVKAAPAAKVVAKPAATPVAKPGARTVVAAKAPRAYPVIIFTGHAKWEPKADALQTQVDQGPDFNDHYKVARLSCGAGCWDNFIINTDTGYILDEIQSCGSAEYSLYSDVINIPVRPSKHGQCRMVSYKVEGDVVIRL